MKNAKRMEKNLQPERTRHEEKQMLDNICNGRKQKSRSTERNEGGKEADRNRRRKGIKARRKETKEDKGTHVRTKQ